jgi:hypothetical protein
MEVPTSLSNKLSAEQIQLVTTWWQSWKWFVNLNYSETKESNETEWTTDVRPFMPGGHHLKYRGTSITDAITEMKQLWMEFGADRLLRGITLELHADAHR